MAFIDAHRGKLGIEPICRELAIAPSSYHEHAGRLADPDRRSARARRDDEIEKQIRRAHDASFGLYGTRKVWHQLRREGIKVAKCTVERLMQSMGLAGIRRGKTTITTVSNPKAPCPLDKVNREFRVSRPNALWVVDFTYVHTWAGFVYVVFVPGGRGDRQFAADRLDTQFLTMAVDERHHHLRWRSSSACAKYADALRRISFARRSSFTSRSSNFKRSRSLPACAVGPVRRLASSRHQRRSVSAVQPIFAAIEFIAAHSEP